MDTSKSVPTCDLTKGFEDYEESTGLVAVLPRMLQKGQVRKYLKFLAQFVRTRLLAESLDIACNIASFENAYTCSFSKILKLFGVQIALPIALLISLRPNAYVVRI